MSVSSKVIFKISTVVKIFLFCMSTCIFSIAATPRPIQQKVKTRKTMQSRAYEFKKGIEKKWAQVKESAKELKNRVMGVLKQKPIRKYTEPREDIIESVTYDDEDEEEDVEDITQLRSRLRSRTI